MTVREACCRGQLEEVSFLHTMYYLCIGILTSQDLSHCNGLGSIASHLCWPSALKVGVLLNGNITHDPLANSLVYTLGDPCTQLFILSSCHITPTQ